MTPLAVFIRTLLRTSAIFIGTAIVFLNPPLEWSAGRAVTAQKSPMESAIDGLIDTLKNDTDVNVRCQAAWALGRTGNPRVLPHLLDALKDDLDVRRQAVRALGELGDSRALPALTAALKDPDARVRRYAARALTKIKPSQP